nr:MAG TPA: hypothetical protein [Bacteriophage sp.]
MINVHNFCNTCADGTTVKLSFYDVNSRDFMLDVIFRDAKRGSSTLRVAFEYANIESIYVSAGVVCCECYALDY